MKKELELQLVNKFPKLFGEYGKSPQETCMAWGCECGDGWYDILYQLCENLSHPFFYGPFKRYNSVPRNFICGWIFDEINEWGEWKIFDKILLKTTRIADEDGGIVFAQIKEKFGTLTIYTNGIASETCKVADGFIDAAERKSAQVCETCGEPGTLKSDGWYRTICNECEKERGR